MAAVVALVVAACLTVGFLVPPAATTDSLPASITVDGVVHERVHLLTLRTTPRREIVTVRVPVTVRSIVVRSSCRLAVLHRGRAKSAFSLETPWQATGGSQDTIPDTKGAEYFSCGDGRDARTERTIDLGWLPIEDGQLRLTWSELPTLADAPSTAPASWAIAVYAAA